MDSRAIDALKRYCPGFGLMLLPTTGRYFHVPFRTCRAALGWPGEQANSIVVSVIDGYAPSDFASCE